MINDGGEIIESQGLVVEREPGVVLAEARKAAVSLQGILNGKKNPVIFNKEQYIEFEDWQVLARFYGLAAKVVSTTPVDFGGVRGFEARAVVVDGKTGLEISAAEAMCLNDEDKWSTRTKYEWKDGKRVKVGEVPVPMFQLRSMAQTRACAKALRNVLAWVVVMAGYKPTVAEEMTGDEVPYQQGPPMQPTTRKSASPAPPAEPVPGAPRKISDAQRKRFFAICRSVGKEDQSVKDYLMDKIGSESSKDIPVDLYEEICNWGAAK